MVTVSPGSWASTATVSSSELPTGLPSTAITTSSSRMPAFAAALPGSTLSTSAPSRALSVTERVATPSVACTAEPVEMSCSAMSRAVSIGMAKPRPIEPPAAGGRRSRC